MPQFIEVEDKIFGPLTFKQFIYVTGGAGACYIFWKILPVYIAAPLVFAIAGLAGALAFMQWNGRPFISALEHAFFYLIHAKLYLWSTKERGGRVVAGLKKGEAGGKPLIYVPKLSDSKLHELAWSLDIKERIAAGIEDRNGAGETEAQ